ncbi:amidohydrolase [Flavobacterium sp. RNTU_13]|uniref:amidohydrolase n=1 Tax=Flavobacterium sp. RNTU_13 TaxID=3375145 RepID=UPI0039886E9B
MKISIIQTTLAWEDAAANRAHFTQLIDTIQETDLIVLPEMFTSGFTMNAAGASEAPNGTSVAWMQQMAQAKNCAVTGSIAIKEDEKYYNRLFFVYPDGSMQTYNKRHLFSYGDEHNHYTKGTEKLIIDYKGWKICPLICYDLRFPVFSRNVEGYDVLLYVASWPQARIYAWDALLKARAIENLSYTIGVNRVGTDAADFLYTGHSQVLDPLGGYILEPTKEDGVFSVTIDKSALEATRTRFAFLNDRDHFDIKL